MDGALDHNELVNRPFNGEKWRSTKYAILEVPLWKSSKERDLKICPYIILHRLI